METKNDILTQSDNMADIRLMPIGPTSPPGTCRQTGRTYSFFTLIKRLTNRFKRKYDRIVVCQMTFHSSMRRLAEEKLTPIL